MRRFLSLLALAFVLGSALFIPAESIQAQPISVQICSEKMGEYSSWIWTEKGWKRALWLWIGEDGIPLQGNQFQVLYTTQKGVKFLVPDHDKYVRHIPQAGREGGWQPYYIATTFALNYWGWQDDWRWDVRRC